MKDIQDENRGALTRRNFLRAAGATTAGATLGAVTMTAAQAQEMQWDETYDVVVVGSGGAGLSAAAAAVSKGASVKVLEKGAITGGTTLKSGGVYWVPNNHLMQEDGLEDPKEDAMRYMCRCAYPHLYKADAPNFGMPANTYRLIEVLYDRGGPVLQELEALGALKTVRYPDYGWGTIFDYYAGLPENKAPRGRSLPPATPDGNPGSGFDLIDQLQTYVEANGGVVVTESPVTQVILDEARVVRGVIAATPEGERRIAATKGVIFATGGFTQNVEMRENYLRMPVMGGCAVPTNQGDFVKIAIEAGAQLGNMNEAWLQQEVLDEVLEYTSVPFGVFFLGGDSMVMVNKFGKRTVNEKTTYNERTRSHLVWDAGRGEYPNRFQFMIFDENARGFGGVMVPETGAPLPPYIMQADTLADLAAQIDAKLASFEDRIGHVRLDAGFLDGLASTIATFNDYARAGKDPEFLRGEAPIETYFSPLPGYEVTSPNPFMHPISDQGPYYAMVLAAGTLDTKGGAVFDEHARVLDPRDQVIEGLYVAGNASASPSGQSYWGAGGTLGLAITYGFIAGSHAASRA